MVVKNINTVVVERATKEVFLPISALVMTGDPNYHGKYPVVRLQTAAEVCYFTFKVPHDFIALTSCEIVGIAETTGTIDWTVETEFAASGEASTTHSDTDTANGVGVTDTHITKISIATALSNLAAHDFVGGKFTLDSTPGSFLHVLGILLKYS